MTNNDNYDKQVALIMGDNVNVGSQSDLKDFFVLLLSIAGIVIVFLIAFNFFANLYIDRMSNDDILKFEKVFSSKLDSKLNINRSNNSKYDEKLKLLNSLQKKIIANDPKIQFKEEFPIYVKEISQANAMIAINGEIYFTSGLLKENLSEQELAFILAHEIGHYVHRDHLKSVSKQIAIYAIALCLGQSKGASSIANGISNAEALKHSQNQEKQADKYASDMLIKMYGTNQGGKDMLIRFEEMEKMPEFLYYFSTHPSNKERIKLLEQQQPS